MCQTCKLLLGTEYRQLASNFDLKHVKIPIWWMRKYETDSLTQ